MGKKKVGKQRHDKYYALAKEAGYRSRAAFKLIQLNRKYRFLERSVCLVDLCAAPGGWLQAASQFMPISKLLIGVDLVPIKALPNVLTIQADITTDACKAAIKRELQTWQADCVLHDGAPNVGKNWLHDAFQQVQLTLQALRLAADILKPGGWFVTKIFRSKDYMALVDVLKKVFKKVHVTKPQASRQESAEVFAVCEGFIAPNDASLLKFAKVFNESSMGTFTTTTSIKALEKMNRKAEGYADDAVTLFGKVDVSMFVKSENHLEVLGGASELVFNDDQLLSHPLTTDNVKLMCKDVKVLNRKEIKELLKWRTAMRQYLQSLQPKAEQPAVAGQPESDDDAKLDEIVKEEKQADKRKRKKEFRENRKYKKKLDYEMIIKEDDPIRASEPNLFSLESVVSKTASIKKTDGDDDDSNSSSEDEGFDGQEQSEWFDRISSAAETAKERTVSGVTKSWFDKEVFKNMESENEDQEVDTLAQEKGQPKKVSSKERNAAQSSSPASKKKVEFEATVEADQPSFSSDSEMEMDQNTDEPEDNLTKSKLDAEALAMGEMLMHSSKKKRQLIEAGINRFTNNDTNLPEWFEEDEKKHCRVILPVEKEAVDRYKRREMGINARTIKKVAEAKFRKKRRAGKRMESAKKKAENIMADEGMTDVEKRRELKKVYKSCKDRPRQVTYVVAKKSGQGHKHVKGRYKMVDRRLKKDTRKLRMKQKKSKGRTKRKK